MRLLLISLFVLILAESRDNPFATPEVTKGLKISTNIPKKVEMFNKAQLKLPSSARKIRRLVVLYQNVDGSLDEKAIDMDMQIDWHSSIDVSHKGYKPVIRKYKKNAKLNFISFATAKNEMKINTKNRLLRNFMLAKPHRIVMDFERFSNFLSKTYKNFQAPFKSVRLGNHNGFYRVVIELDGEYQYRVVASKKSYVIKLR